MTNTTLAHTAPPATGKPSKLYACIGCGGIFPAREMIELTEGNHDDLTYFDGDHLCGSCSDLAGVTR